MDPSLLEALNEIAKKAENQSNNLQVSVDSEIVQSRKVNPQVVYKLNKDLISGGVLSHVSHSSHSSHSSHRSHYSHRSSMIA